MATATQTINTCTNCTASVTVDRTVPTVDSATMANTTHDGTQQTTGFVNDEDEISLAVVFSDEIVSTPVITVSGQATATVTAAGNISWSYTRALGTAESNNALLAILIDANSGTPATSWAKRIQRVQWMQRVMIVDTSGPKYLSLTALFFSR